MSSRKDAEKSNNLTTIPDGGWGWMVAIGCGIIVFLMPLLTTCFSILFSGFLMDLEATSTTTAWIFNLHTLLWNLVGPFTGPLSNEFGFRKLCLIGSIMASISVFCCAFATSTTYLLVFFSLAGLFGGMTCKPCYLIIPVFFDKRRGMANAILMGGMCAGQFVSPLLIRLLLRQFSFTGAAIIVSSVLLNACIGAAFFQPVEWHQRRLSVTDMKCLPATKGDPLESNRNGEVESLMGEDNDKGFQGNHKDVPLSAKEVLRKRHRHVSESSVRSSIAISMVDLSSISSPVEEKPRDEDGPSQSLIVRVIKSLISDVCILRYHRAQIIAFGGLFFINGYLNFLMAAPFAVQAAGFSPDDAAMCISITGVCNFIARLGASVLSDYSWFNMKIMYVVGAVIVAASSAVFAFLSSLTLMKVTLGVWAFGIGINISLYPLVMARIMGAENMPAIFGTQSLIVGIGYIALGPLIGYIRDVTGSYGISMLIMSAECCLCVIFWCFMPLAIRRDAAKIKAQEELTKDTP